MIKFFSRIRRSLIKQNQMGKYFKYAIGEIALVVIGILIALQINNWNEERKENTLLISYYEQLHEELNTDIQAINFSIKRLDQDIKAYDQLKKYLNKPNIKKEEIIKLYKKTSFLFDNVTFNTKTIEVLKSTGDIKLIPRHLRNALIALENEQEDHLNDSDNRYSFFLENYGDLVFLSGFTDSNYWESKKQIAKKLNIEEEAIKELPKADKAAYSRNLSNIYAQKELQNVLEQTLELKRFVNKELEKND